MKLAHSFLGLGMAILVGCGSFSPRESTSLPGASAASVNANAGPSGELPKLATYSIPLRKGWNTIGFRARHLTSVAISGPAISGFSYQRNGVKVTGRASDFNLAFLQGQGIPARGVQIFAPATGSSLDYSGDNDTALLVPLEQGLNLVSFPADGPVPVSRLRWSGGSLAATISSSTVTELNQDGTGTSVDLSAPGAVLQPGKAYWMNSIVAQGSVSGVGLWVLGPNNSLTELDPNGFGTWSSGIVTGLRDGETLVGIDFRPATGQLYGLGYNFALVGLEGGLYTIDFSTRVATRVGSPFAMPRAIGSSLNAATGFGFDFDPVLDLIRVVSTGRDNFRLNPDTGVAQGDTILTPFGASVVGAAYSNSVAGATTTTLFAIDRGTSPDQLAVIGGNPGPPSANDGVLTVVGALGFDSPSNEVGFDISRDGTALALVNGGGGDPYQLFTVNVATGASTPVFTAAGSTKAIDLAFGP